MIRFLAGVVIGTLGTLYIVAAFLPATRQAPASRWQHTAAGGTPIYWYPSVWGTNTDDSPQWTYTTSSPAT